MNMTTDNFVRSNDYLLVDFKIIDVGNHNFFIIRPRTTHNKNRLVFCPRCNYWVFFLFLHTLRYTVIPCVSRYSYFVDANSSQQFFTQFMLNENMVKHEQCFSKHTSVPFEKTMIFTK